MRHLAAVCYTSEMKFHPPTEVDHHKTIKVVFGLVVIVKSGYLDRIFDRRCWVSVARIVNGTPVCYFDLVERY